MIRTWSVVGVAAVVAAALSFPGAARAQEDAEAQLTVPGLTAALAEDALALKRNPAGLSFLRGGELRLLLTRRGVHTPDEAYLPAGYWAAGFGGVAAGLGVEWVRGVGVPHDYRRTRLGLAAGDTPFSLGASVNWYASADPVLDDAVTFDFGLSSRPLKAFGWAFTVRDFGTSVRTPELSLGVAFDLWRERLVLGVDDVWRTDENPFAGEGRIEAGLKLRVIDGLRLLGGLAQPLGGGSTRVQLGLALDFAHLGLGLAVPPTSDHPGEDGLIDLRLSTSRYRALGGGTEWAAIDLDEALEGAAAGPFAVAPRLPFVDLLRLLDQARRDPDLQGVVLRSSGSGLSFGQAEELRRALADLKAAGKGTAFLLDGCDDATYYAAAGVDRILATPGAIFLVNGLASTSLFLGAGLSKLGVNPEFVRVGRYKNAPDQFTRSDMSEAEREVENALLDDLYGRYLATLAEDRELDREAAEAFFALGVADAETAKAKGLVDGIAYPDQLEDVLGASLVHDYADRIYAHRPWGPTPILAVIPVVGNIVSGETPAGLFAGDATGAETAVEAIRKAAANPAVFAILVRIDSPGGDAGASDLIWRALREANEHKPVIASMGSVAASGGYYVAAGTQYIVADPSTLTGSIGIFAGHVDLRGLFEKIGLDLVTLRRGELSDILGVDGPWTEQERDRMQAFVDGGYRLFLSRVAATRPLTVEQVDAVARGRVWTGAQAASRGLVDRLGSFRDAVEEAKARAGLPPETVVDMAVFDGTFFDIAAFSGEGRPFSRTVPKTLAPLVRSLGPAALLLDGRHVLALMPRQIEVH